MLSALGTTKVQVKVLYRYTFTFIGIHLLLDLRTSGLGQLRINLVKSVKTLF